MTRKLPEIAEIPEFDTLPLSTPDPKDVGEQYEVLLAQFNPDSEISSSSLEEVISGWNALRCKLFSSRAMSRLKFCQDTADEGYKKVRDFWDAYTPTFTEWEVKMKKALLSSSREMLDTKYGMQLCALWSRDVESFRSEIAEDLAEENKLGSQYTELLASAQIPFQGDTYNLSQLGKFYVDADRSIRHEAQKARWGWTESVGEQLDDIFDKLVKLRHKMARKLGYDNYIELGYRRMHRIDYDREDVKRFRDEVRRVVVPAAQQLRERQAANLGVDELFQWDESVFDLKGNPAPKGDADWMVEQAKLMFDEMGHGLGEFFRCMAKQNYIDLKSRANKAGGGFCTSFPTIGMPYVFANFNGTKGDVEVFSHEMGHAFQNWSSRSFDWPDYVWATLESAEIHSMSLEFLTYNHMDKFFGEDAGWFRQVHLTGELLFFAYGVAVDHFQHMLYERPEASPQERKEMWSEVESIYLPWRNWGDLSYGAQGGRWQLQRHIYGRPFYYIDYTLALACAMQFWLKAEDDYALAMKDYVALCQRGGSAPFQELVKSAGLISPFQNGCLEDVIAKARKELKLG